MGIASIRFILIIIFSILLLNCNGDKARELVLFDFESDSELDQLHWNCHTLYSLSNEQHTHGTKSLKLEIYPSDYPGLTPMLKENNWKGYKELRFDVYNPEVSNMQISVRIDDQRDYPDYGDRYNKSFILKPGINHVSIAFDTLVTSGTARSLNLKNICRLLIFMKHPEKKAVLYVDYLRLLGKA